VADEEQEQHRQEELAKFYFDSFKHTSTLSAGAGAEKLLGGQVLEVVTWTCRSPSSG
jgi:hypothetical protein